MTVSCAPAVNTRAVRFHNYGEPSEVLHLDDAVLPAPGPERIRVRVQACGLNPADWALCRGLFPGGLPRGIGLDVSGIVDAVGEGVQGVVVGDAMFGAADFAGAASAGAADFAVLQHWARRPAGLTPVEAAALPLTVETAYRSLDSLGVTAGQTVMVNGAGTTVGFAAVQMALMRGARVVASAGDTFADQLRALGALVTSYGDGMAERVLSLTGTAPDLILDTAPISGVLPVLVQIAGDPTHVFTISDFAAAQALGVRSGIGEAVSLRYDVLGDFAQLAADRRFTVPVALTFALEDWRAAMEISLGGQPRGKLILLPGSAD